MPNITLAIPEELHKIIKRHAEIRWSEIARKVMWDYAKKIEALERIAAKSKLTEEDALTIDSKIKEELLRRYKKLLE
ncbi:MAG: hypothetical protein ACE5OY_07920 [Candidatus Bathyarchaeia archaeon]